MAGGGGDNMMFNEILHGKGMGDSNYDDLLNDEDDSDDNIPSLTPNDEDDSDDDNPDVAGKTPVNRKKINEMMGLDDAQKVAK